METSISGNLLPRTFPALHWNTGQSMVANEVLLQVSIKNVCIGALPVYILTSQVQVMFGSHSEIKHTRTTVV